MRKDIDGNQLFTRKGKKKSKQNKSFPDGFDIISFYSKTIVDAYEKMIESIEYNDKSITNLVERESFKYALNLLSFVSMWLHASLRFRMLNMKLTDKVYKRNKGKTYELRLMLVGCYDEILLKRVSFYRMARNKILFEIDSFPEVQVLFAETEAEKAYELFVELTDEFKRLEISSK